MGNDNPGIGRLRRELGFWDLLVFGLVSIAPIAIFGMFGWVNASSGGAVVPSYIFSALALVLTALSYGTMAAIRPSAGSGFAYARFAMGPLVGFVAGWAILLDYMLVTALTGLYAAIYLNAAIPAVPVEIWLGGFLAISLVSNLLGVRWSMSVDLAIGGIQFLFCAVFIVLAALEVLKGTVPSAPIWPTGVPIGIAIAGAPVAVITYLGFDSVVTLTEEVRGGDPGRVAGRAGVAVVLVLMFIFVAIGWLLQSLGQGLEFSDPSQSSYVVISARLPILAWPLSLILGLGFGIGCVVSLHAGVSRVLFSMGRERQLPKALSLVHSRTNVPWVATLASGLVITIVAYLALPNVDLLGGLVSYGALLSFLIVNLSVIAHFGFKQASRSVLGHWVIPIFGILAILYVLTGLKPLALEVGTAWLALGAVIQLLSARLPWARQRPQRGR